MGKLDLPLELGNPMELHLPSDVYVVASASRLAELADGVAGGQVSALSLVAVPDGEPVPADVVAAARVLVVAVDHASPASMARVGQIRAARADLPLIVALADASMAQVRTLVRQGVSDVASLPFDCDELISRILDVSAAGAMPGHGHLAPMIALVGGTNGGGATTALTHLAAELAGMGERKCCVIDLDLQFGDVAAYLGESPALSVVDLLEAGDRLDAEFMRSAAKETGHGFTILSAPHAIAPLEGVDIDQLLRLLEIARREYDLVLLDLPANWTNWTLSAALASNEILLLTDQSLAGLRQARRMIEMFAAVGLTRSRIRLVVNRVEKKLFQSISVNDVADALGCDVWATLAEDGAAIQTAQDQGMLAGEVNRRSRFVGDIRKLAEQVAARIWSTVS